MKMSFLARNVKQLAGSTENPSLAANCEPRIEKSSRSGC